MPIRFCAPIVPPDVINKRVPAKILDALRNTPTADTCRSRNSTQTGKRFSFAVHAFFDIAINCKISASDFRLKDLVLYLKPAAGQVTNKIPIL